MKKVIKGVTKVKYRNYSQTTPQYDIQSLILATQKSMDNQDAIMPWYSMRSSTFSYFMTDCRVFVSRAHTSMATYITRGSHRTYYHMTLINDILFIYKSKLINLMLIVNCAQPHRGICIYIIILKRTRWVVDLIINF